jgi:thiol-disulfide isomerase/thioredoxin
MKKYTKMLNKLLNNRIILIILVFVLLYILWKCVSTIEGMTSSENVFQNSPVPPSTPSTFKSDLGTDPKLVWFYAEWCGHCKSMLSDWDKLAQENNNGEKMIKINVGDQGNSAQEDLAKEYNVSAYPTIYIIDGSNKTEYEGERNYSGLKLALP